VIPLARNHASAVLAMLVLAVLAVALHQTFAARFDPCVDPAQLLRLAAYGHSYRIQEREAVAERPSQRWIEGTLLHAGPGGDDLWFRVARADEPYAMFDRPYLIVPILPQDQAALGELRSGADVLPVHRIFDDSFGPVRLTRYFFVQGVSPVAHPIVSDIGIAWRQLVRGTLPVTVFAVTGIADAEKRTELEAAEDAWLSAVWSEFRRACGS
jgi:hypothetical protein